MASVFVPWVANSQVGVFGKVPSAGDFVHARVGDDQRLCDWLQRGVERANTRLGAKWQALFDSGGAQGFLMRQPSGTVLGGVIAPSRDAVGRRFPLCAYVVLDASDASTVRHLVPWALSPFTQAIGVALTSDVAADPLVSLRGLTVAPVAAEAGFAQYDEWLRTTLAVDWFAQLWGRQDAELLRYTVAMMASSLEPYQGQEHSANPLALRLPLAGDLRAAAFWMDLVARLGGWKATVPTVFWEPARPTTLLVQLGETRPSSYVELWSQGSDDEHVIDLCNLGAVTAEPYLAGVSPVLLQRLGAQATTLGEILTAASGAKN